MKPKKKRSVLNGIATAKKKQPPNMPWSQYKPNQYTNNASHANGCRSGSILAPRAAILNEREKKQHDILSFGTNRLVGRFFGAHYTSECSEWREWGRRWHTERWKKCTTMTTCARALVRCIHDLNKCVRAPRSQFSIIRSLCMHTYTSFSFPHVTTRCFSVFVLLGRMFSIHRANS